MRLVVRSRVTGDERDFQVPGGAVTIGRGTTLRGDIDAKSADLHLTIPSPFLSQPHCRIVQDAGLWRVEALGKNPVRLNEQTLAARIATPIAQGDELDFGDFVIGLFADAVAPAARIDDKDVASTMAGLELAVHAGLLDAMDLRRTDRTLDIEDPGVQATLLGHVGRILDKQLDSLSAEMRRALARHAILKLLTFRVTGAGGEILTSVGALLARQPLSPIAARNIEREIKRLTESLGLEMTLRSLERDLERLDKSFDAAFDEGEIELGSAVLVDLIALYLRQSTFALVFGLGPLQELMEMEAVSEVMVVARDQIFVEKGGVIVDSRRAFPTDESLLGVIERIVAPIGRRIDKSSPMVDAHLPDGSRVNAVVPPLAIKGPCVTIRKFRKSPMTIDDLVSYGALSTTMRDFLGACVRGRKNIVVSGGTGSGKTTLLNCLSSFIGEAERVVTVEDTAELQLRQPHVVSLESRPANMEGKGAVSIRDLVRNALRMRPDRVVVGECRGGEALDMLQAMNTGHDGSMTTAHANQPVDMIRRLETMVLMAVEMPIAAIREQIASAVDVIVQVQRFADGARRITHISEVVAVDPQTKDIVVEHVFATQRHHGGSAHATYTGYLPTFAAELLAKKQLELGLFFKAAT
jgi:pilus assembly protein CpaF